MVPDRSEHTDLIGSFSPVSREQEVGRFSSAPGRLFPAPAHVLPFFLLWAQSILDQTVVVAGRREAFQQEPVSQKYPIPAFPPEFSQVQGLDQERVLRVFAASELPAQSFFLVRQDALLQVQGRPFAPEEMAVQLAPSASRVVNAALQVWERSWESVQPGELQV